MLSTIATSALGFAAKDLAAGAKRANVKAQASSEFAYGLPGNIAPAGDFDPAGFLQGKSELEVMRLPACDYFECAFETFGSADDAAAAAASAERGLCGVVSDGGAGPPRVRVVRASELSPSAASHAPVSAPR